MPMRLRNLIGLQRRPTSRWRCVVRREARLYTKYGLDFSLVYIASSGIVTGGDERWQRNVAIAGARGPIRAFLGGNTSSSSSGR